MKYTIQYREKESCWAPAGKWKEFNIEFDSREEALRWLETDGKGKFLYPIFYEFAICRGGL